MRNKDVFVKRALRTLIVLFVIGILACNIVIVQASQKTEYINRNKNRVHISWNIPDEWNKRTYTYKYNISVVAQPSTTFDPYYYIYDPEEDLTNYATITLPIYSGWTMVSNIYTDKEAPNIPYDSKTYMKFQTLGYNSWNRQSHLSRGSYAYTGDYQIRMVDGRMLIALGTHYCSTIGTYIDVELENGNVLACMLGDVKSDAHTDETHRYQKWDHSVLEFVVDSPGSSASDYSVIRALGIDGNYSVLPCFNSRVKSIRVYDRVFPINMNDLSNDNPDRG